MVNIWKYAVNVKKNYHKEYSQNWWRQSMLEMILSFNKTDGIATIDYQKSMTSSSFFF